LTELPVAPTRWERGSRRAHRHGHGSSPGVRLSGHSRWACSGQVACHLLAAVHATSAPWPTTMFVSCLPVVALALGTALARLLREPGEDVPSAYAATGTVAGVLPEVPVGTSVTAPGVPQGWPEDVPLATCCLRARVCASGTPVRASEHGTYRTRCHCPDSGDQACSGEQGEEARADLRGRDQRW